MVYNKKETEILGFQNYFMCRCYLAGNDDGYVDGCATEFHGIFMQHLLLQFADVQE